MVLQRIRRAAAVLALAATLALAAPAHAAGWKDLAAGPAWLERAMEWVARLWAGDDLPTPVEKCSYAINPDGSCSGAPKSGAAINPNGSSGGNGSE